MRDISVEKSVYYRIDDFHRYIFVLSVARVNEIMIALFFVGDFWWITHFFHIWSYIFAIECQIPVVLSSSRPFNFAQ